MRCAAWCCGEWWWRREPGHAGSAGGAGAVIGALALTAPPCTTARADRARGCRTSCGRSTWRRCGGTRSRRTTSQARTGRWAGAGVSCTLCTPRPEACTARCVQGSLRLLRPSALRLRQSLQMPGPPWSSSSGRRLTSARCVASGTHTHTHARSAAAARHLAPGTAPWWVAPKLTPTHARRGRAGPAERVRRAARAARGAGGLAQGGGGPAPGAVRAAGAAGGRERGAQGAHGRAARRARPAGGRCAGGQGAAGGGGAGGSGRGGCGGEAGGGGGARGAG